MTLAPLLTAAPAVKIHVIAAVAALVSGAAIASMPKGTPRHRALGRLAAIAMLVTALTSFFIFGQNGWSPIHALSLVTLVSLSSGLWFIRMGNVPAHRGSMTGAWLGLLGAAAFTLWPGRIMHQVFFG